MFDLDLIIYNSIKDVIQGWSTTYGLFGFMKFAVITSVSVTTLTQFFKIKSGDTSVSKTKR